MTTTDNWKVEWDNELRQLPNVESITCLDLQLTENVFLIWQFLKLYLSASPQVRSIIDFIAVKKAQSLQWGDHIDSVMSSGLRKGQDLFHVFLSNGKKIQTTYSKKKLCDRLQYYHIKNYIILEKINTGSVGQVHVALDKSTDTFVAAKAIDKSTVQGDIGLFEKLKDEIKISCMMNHPNVVKTLNILETKDKIIQIMEYCDAGDLISYVRNKLYLDEVSAQYFFRKIVQGLKYMHKNNIAHRDLKPENIFLCKIQISQKEKTLIRVGKLPSCIEYDLKIGDFGACCVNEKDKLHYDIVGTLSYAAPEVLNCNNKNGYNSEKADIWSLGIILYAMLFGLLPYDSEDKDVKEAYNEIIKKKIVFPKNRVNKFSTSVRNLLLAMLNINPQNRLSLDEVIKHEWLAGTAKSRLEMSNINKKINFPLSSTVGYPIYSNKNIIDYNIYKRLALIKNDHNSSTNSLYSNCNSTTISNSNTTNMNNNMNSNMYNNINAILNVNNLRDKNNVGGNTYKLDNISNSVYGLHNNNNINSNNLKEVLYNHMKYYLKGDNKYNNTLGEHKNDYNLETLLKKSEDQIVGDPNVINKNIGNYLTGKNTKEININNKIANLVIGNKNGNNNIIAEKNIMINIDNNNNNNNNNNSGCMQIKYNENKKDEELVNKNKIHSICSSNDHKLYDMNMFQKNDNSIHENVNIISNSSNKEISGLQNKYVEKIYYLKNNDMYLNDDYIKDKAIKNVEKYNIVNKDKNGSTYKIKDNINNNTVNKSKYNISADKFKNIIALNNNIISNDQNRHLYIDNKLSINKHNYNNVPYYNYYYYYYDDDDQKKEYNKYIYKKKKCGTNNSELISYNSIVYEKGNPPYYNINNAPISSIKYDSSIYNGNLSHYVNNSSYDKKICSSSYIKDNKNDVNKMNIEKSTILNCSTNELYNVHKKETPSEEIFVNNNHDLFDINKDANKYKCNYNYSAVNEKENNNNNINVGELKSNSPNNSDSNNISSNKHITVKETCNNNISKTQEDYIIMKMNVNNPKCDNNFELAKMNEHIKKCNNSKYTNSDIDINDKGKNATDVVSMDEMNNFNKIDNTEVCKKKISELSNDNQKYSNIYEDKNIHMHVIKEDSNNNSTIISTNNNYSYKCIDDDVKRECIYSIDDINYAYVNSSVCSLNADENESRDKIIKNINFFGMDNIYSTVHPEKNEENKEDINIEHIKYNINSNINEDIINSNNIYNTDNEQHFIDDKMMSNINSNDTTKMCGNIFQHTNSNSICEIKRKEKIYIINVDTPHECNEIKYDISYNKIEAHKDGDNNEKDIYVYKDGHNNVNNEYEKISRLNIKKYDINQNDNYNNKTKEEKNEHKIESNFTKHKKLILDDQKILYTRHLNNYKKLIQKDYINEYIKIEKSNYFNKEHNKKYSSLYGKNDIINIIKFNDCICDSKNSIYDGLQDMNNNSVKNIFNEDKKIYHELSNNSVLHNNLFTENNLQPFSSNKLEYNKKFKCPYNNLMRNYSYSEYRSDIKNKISTYINKVDINKVDSKESYSNKRIRYINRYTQKNENVNIYDDIKKCSSNNNIFYIDEDVSYIDITNLSDKEIKSKNESEKKKNISSNKKCILSNPSNICIEKKYKNYEHLDYINKIKKKQMDVLYQNNSVSFKRSFSMLHFKGNVKNDVNYYYDNKKEDREEKDILLLNRMNNYVIEHKNKINIYDTNPKKKNYDLNDIHKNGKSLIDNIPFVTKKCHSSDIFLIRDNILNNLSNKEFKNIIGRNLSLCHKFNLVDTNEDLNKKTKNQIINNNIICDEINISNNKNCKIPTKKYVNNKCEPKQVFNDNDKNNKVHNIVSDFILRREESLMTKKNNKRYKSDKNGCINSNIISYNEMKKNIYKEDQNINCVVKNKIYDKMNKNNMKKINLNKLNISHNTQNNNNNMNTYDNYLINIKDTLDTYSLTEKQYCQQKNIIDKKEILHYDLISSNNWDNHLRDYMLHSLSKNHYTFLRKNTLSKDIATFNDINISNIKKDDTTSKNKNEKNISEDPKLSNDSISYISHTNIKSTNVKQNNDRINNFQKKKINEQSNTFQPKVKWLNIFTRNFNKDQLGTKYK
ncbi:serine/threonine protein kinase, putative [Plasmodium sp. gorilla clade G2]|uniref:serine/threonine protein kinase, putative n=1 Tax=Plasmodium sp. gorilla clade G2 TaxID=880535 RepID=UPI000D2039C3|nr:serine/threonine protein kinase, putative [Plasmodium sp. gorilla clade G2]SOV19320.1 serine/threonine protein kinase, putative [Plasmodium sp. gorilla clade G2]